MGGRKRRAVDPQPVEYLQLFDPELRRFRGTILSRITLFHGGTLQRGRFFFATRLVNSNRHWLRSALPLRTNGVLLFVEQKSKFFLLINHSKYSVEISKDTGFYRSDHFANWESSSPSPFRRHFSVDSTLCNLSTNVDNTFPSFFSTVSRCLFKFPFPFP